jgi:Flp pilus assembly protein TadG
MTTKAACGREGHPRPLFRRILRLGKSDQGGSLVEMALVCAFVYMPMLFGIFQVSYGVYVYNYVCSMSNMAARYAAVRGSFSCGAGTNFVDCNLNPAGSSNPANSAGGALTLQNFVTKLSFAGVDPSRVTVTPTWYSESFSSSGGGYSVANWNTACTSTDTNGSACNTPGDAVEVVVTYNFPLNIPFWGSKILPISGKSRIMINY